MKHVYAAIAGLSLVTFAVAPALAGDQKSKTSDTQKVPAGAGASVTTDPKTDVSPNVNTGAPTQGSGSVTTDSPSASPATSGTTEVNPSKPSDTPSASPSDTSDSQDKAQKPEKTD